MYGFGFAGVLYGFGVYDDSPADADDVAVGLGSAGAASEEVPHPVRAAAANRPPTVIFFHKFFSEPLGLGLATSAITLGIPFSDSYQNYNSC